MEALGAFLHAMQHAVVVEPMERWHVGAVAAAKITDRLSAQPGEGSPRTNVFEGWAPAGGIGDQPEGQAPAVGIGDQLEGQAPAVGLIDQLEGLASDRSDAIASGRDDNVAIASDRDDVTPAGAQEGAFGVGSNGAPDALLRPARTATAALSDRSPDLPASVRLPESAHGGERVSVSPRSRREAMLLEFRAAVDGQRRITAANWAAIRRAGARALIAAIQCREECGVASAGPAASDVLDTKLAAAQGAAAASLLAARRRIEAEGAAWDPEAPDPDAFFDGDAYFTAHSAHTRLLVTWVRQARALAEEVHQRALEDAEALLGAPVILAVYDLIDELEGKAPAGGIGDQLEGKRAPAC